MKYILTIILILITSCKETEYEFGPLHIEVMKLEENSLYTKYELDRISGGEILKFLEKYEMKGEYDGEYNEPNYIIQFFTSNKVPLDEEEIFIWKDEKNRHLTVEEENQINEILKTIKH